MAADEIKRVIGTIAAGATLDEAEMERVLGRFSTYGQARRP